MVAQFLSKRSGVNGDALKIGWMQFFGGMILLSIIFIVTGCSGTGVTTRAYVEDKERVDQEMSGGNFGYLYGQPVAEDRSEYKKTRRVYVVELTKEPEQVEEEPLIITRTKTVYVESEPAAEPVAQQPAQPARIEIPSFDEPVTEAARPSDVSAGAQGGSTEYTVEKNDTLQKISKKFYDTYRKWPQIYEANKDVISDPNSIKPGIVLQIPNE